MRRVYYDIVQLNDYSVVQEFPQDFVLHGLESCGSVNEPERHDLVFLLSVSCTQGSLVFIAFSHPNKMVSIFWVALRKYFCSSNAVS